MKTLLVRPMILHQNSQNSPGAVRCGQGKVPAAYLHLWIRAKACKPRGARLTNPETSSRHSLIDILVMGDFEIDQHHTVEDTVMTLSQAVLRAVGGTAGIARFADVLHAMDGAATFCAIARNDPRCDI